MSFEKIAENAKNSHDPPIHSLHTLHTHAPLASNQVSYTNISDLSHLMIFDKNI